MQSTSEHLSYTEMPLHDVTAEHGETGLRQRLNYEVGQTGWSNGVRELITQAEELALEAHENDSRGEHPYSTHFLRVAIRVMSDSHLGVKNPNLVIAALLHDTVEDHAKFYADDPNNARELAFLKIDEVFGPEVGRLTRALTNPERPKSITTQEEKHEFYREHVRELLLTDEEAGIVKLSDFIDNCAGLKYNEDFERAARVAHKYLPLVGDFRIFVMTSSLLSERAMRWALKQLDTAENRCLDVLEAA